VLGKDDKPQSHQSLRQITRKTGVSLTSVHRIVKRDLSLKCVKRTQAQEVTAANKDARLARCRKLLRLYSPEMVQMMWFTDKKLFPSLRCRISRMIAVMWSHPRRRKKLTLLVCCIHDRHTASC